MKTGETRLGGRRGELLWSDVSGVGSLPGGGDRSVSCDPDKCTTRGGAGDGTLLAIVEVGVVDVSKITCVGCMTGMEMLCASRRVNNVVKAIVHSNHT